MFFIRLLFILAVLSNIALFIYNRENVPTKVYFSASDPGVRKLVLLSEVDLKSTIWEEQNPTQDSLNEAFNQTCFTSGPFNKKSDLQPVLDSLKDNVLKTRTRKIISSQEAGYWVYVPAMKTREEALEIGRNLSLNDIDDYYVVTVGENENTISLGLYRELGNADDRIAELKSKGFTVEKQIKIEQWPEFWLDYTIASDQLENRVDINELYPDVSTNQVECNW
jgi:hypothetical protein